MAETPLGTPTDNQPPGTPGSAIDAHTAADMIRQKLTQIYAQEPNAAQEETEAEHATHRSRHQQFMYDLSTSGKSLAAVQTEWHNYYQKLPDTEKHIVWQEFYASQPLLSQPAAVAAASQPLAVAEHKHQVVSNSKGNAKLRDARNAQEVQSAIRNSVSAGGKLKAKHHLQSIFFGLGMGTLAIIVVLFGFFNEIIIAPFIQPSRVSASTPIIIEPGSVAPTKTSEVIIPKINVEIPVNYNETSTNESDIENDLQDGVVHYPTTVMPGQAGNTAFFGHSSNNIFNPGHYKFAFVLLHTLVNGDTFYLTYNSKVYVYKVISHTIVDPSDVSVLGPVAGQAATATLITCDPPGTSLHRLVVVGQQISPDPSGNSAAPAATTTSTPTNLPGNGPTLWTRIVSTLVGKVSLIAILVLALFAIIRWINAPLRAARQHAT